LQFDFIIGNKKDYNTICLIENKNKKIAMRFILRENRFVQLESKKGDCNTICLLGKSLQNDLSCHLSAIRFVPKAGNFLLVSFGTPYDSSSANAAYSGILK